MKAQFEQIDSPLHHSFTLRELTLPAFDAPYHVHPELELTLIISSSGQRFVGTAIADFGPGDLVLLGTSLPHRWRNDRHNTDPAQALVIQFQQDFLGNQLWKAPELGPVNRLLGQAQAGLHFTGGGAAAAAEQMQALVNTPSLARLTGLLLLLNTLAHTDSVPLDPSYAQSGLSMVDYERINRIYGYVAEHFQTSIRLEEAAQLVHMTPQSFCRYFKKTTHKTFIELVNEFRIRHATRQLIDHAELPISQVCCQSGFGNLSHFINQFRQAMGCSPRQFRRKFWSA